MKSFALLIAMASIHVTFAFLWLSRHHSQPQNHNSRLQMSFGDPDLSSKSEFYRKFQSFTRLYDRFIFNDRDIPGLTFASPVEWAPWMETIWFGNYYDYRSAYFGDVMYSNTLPQGGKEGALLHRDPTASLQLALLYQRYKKFDESSYSLSNGTFFNLFAASNLRLGRYKVILPSDNQLILCTSDPLTYSDLRRYVNSFAMLKWFKAKFMQQKRKRQVVLSLSSADFFAQCVHFIEFGAAIDAMQRREGGGKGGARVMTVPILPLPSYLACHDSNDSSDGLAFSYHQARDSRVVSCSWPTAVVNSQYFLDNLWTQAMQQLSAKSTAGRLKVMTGGDGRLLNDFGLDRLLNVNQAMMTYSNSNRIELVLSSRGKLTIEQAISSIQSGEVQAAIVLSVGEEQLSSPSSSPSSGLDDINPPFPFAEEEVAADQEERKEQLSFSSEGGLGGRWGYTVLFQANNNDDSSSGSKGVQSWSSEQYLSVAEAMTKAESVKIVLSRHDDSILNQLYSFAD